jgi:TolA-binding protein
VEEGEVTVASAQGRVRVRAPESWSSPASRSTASGNAPVLDPSASLKPATSGGSEPPILVLTRQGHSSGSATGRPTATLEEEAQLLRDGLAAERQGRAADAAAAFNELISRYPRSPLAPDGRQALARVRARQEQ